MKFILGVLIGSLLALPAWAGQTWRLNEAKVVERILQTHLQIQAAQEDANVAASEVLSARGVYDSTLSATVEHEIDKSSKSASAIFGTRTDTTKFDIEVLKKWPTGTETTVGFGNNRTKVVGSAFMNPLEYEAKLTIGARQPLLKNVAGYADRRSIEVAKEVLKGVDLLVQRKTHEALRTAIGFFWRVAFLQREVAIAQQAVKAAQAFLSITEERYRLGTADGTDLLAAKANVASREANVLATKTALEGALRGIKTELQIPTDDSVVTSAGLPQPSHKIPSEDGAISLGLANRPDYLAVQHRVEQMDLKLQIAHNKKWPSLDLVSTLALNQLAMTSYGDAVRGMDNPDFLVGLQLQLPLENRKAKGERDKARHEKALVLIDLKAAENQIVHEIEERLSSLRLLLGQVGSQAKAEELQRSRLDLEQEQYQLGRSSSLEVIRAQDDFLAAQLAVVRARNDYQQARLDYLLATAQLP